jgi:hypothetical protein
MKCHHGVLISRRQNLHLEECKKLKRNFAFTWCRQKIVLNRERYNRG